MEAVSLLNGQFQLAKRQPKKERPRVFRGDRLKTIREHMKMSQDDFDQFLGFSQDTVRRYESGESDPSAAQLTEIAKQVQVTTDWLLGLSDDPETSYRAEKKLSVELQILIAKWEAGLLDEVASIALGEFIRRKKSDDSDDTKFDNKNSTGDAA